MEEKEEYLEKYVNAIKTAIEEAPLRKDDSVYISDLWVITSLPIDLIIECVKSKELEIPSRVKRVTNRGKVVVKNPRYFPQEDA